MTARRPDPEEVHPSMRVISRRALTEFARVHPDAAEPLDRWYRVALRAAWHRFAEVRADFPHADQVGTCVAFNIGGNKYRLITWIDYEADRRAGRVFIRAVLTHAEYDKGGWKADCR